MLGVTGDLGKMLGLEPRWAFNVIRASAITANCSTETSDRTPASVCRAVRTALDGRRPALLAALPLTSVFSLSA